MNQDFNFLFIKVILYIQMIWDCQQTPKAFQVLLIPYLDKTSLTFFAEIDVILTFEYLSVICLTLHHNLNHNILWI
jgi:hypothetical protein